MRAIEVREIAGADPFGVTVGARGSGGPWRGKYQSSMSRRGRRGRSARSIRRRRWPMCTTSSSTSRSSSWPARARRPSLFPSSSSLSSIGSSPGTWPPSPNSSAAMISATRPARAAPGRRPPATADELDQAVAAFNGLCGSLQRADDDLRESMPSSGKISPPADTRRMPCARANSGFATMRRSLPTGSWETGPDHQPHVRLRARRQFQLRPR